MRNSAKGVLAAGAAVALLVGGGGTLAFWQVESEPVTSQQLSSGALALTKPVCDGWLLEGTPLVDGVPLIVPGDTLTQECTTTLTATGEHMEATLALSTTDPGWTGVQGLDEELVATASYKVGTDTAADRVTVTEADNGADIVITIEVDFDGPAATNSSQASTALLDELTLAATQLHS